MPRLNGLQLAKDLRRLDKQVFLLLVSGREEYVFESLQAKPFRFIRKASFDADLNEAVEQLAGEMLESREDSHITVQSGTVSLRLNASRIIYVESLDKYLNMVAQSRNFSIRYKLSDMEKLLMPYGFIRIHKSYLVNYRFIFSIESRNVVLDSGQKLPLSRYREREVQQKFQELTE